MSKTLIAKEIMTKEVVTISENELLVAIKKLVENKISGMPLSLMPEK